MLLWAATNQQIMDTSAAAWDRWLLHTQAVLSAPGSVGIALIFEESAV